MTTDTAAGPVRLTLPRRRELSLEQLSNAQIRLLASSGKADTAAASRADLLDVISTEAQQTTGLSWTVKVGKGIFPVRCTGLLVSHNEQLYMVGGAGSYSETESLMMTCLSDARCWKPVVDRNEPSAGLSRACTGLVHDHALYAIGTKCGMSFSNSDAGSTHPDLPVHAAVLYTYRFWFKDWECSRLPENAAFSTSSLLAAYKDQLIMFGGGEDTSPQDAVWSFDISTQTWQMQSTSGDVPKPHEACALAVQNGCAYLLTAERVNLKGLIIFELDLNTWHWRRLPAAPTPFFMDRSAGFANGRKHTLATGILKGCWVVVGGGCCYGEAAEKYDQLHVFDFAKLSWITPPFYRTTFPCRRGHMAVCHNDAMIVMGGLCEEGLPDDIFCIRAEPRKYSRDASSAVLSNCQARAVLHPSYTDFTFSVGGQDFQLHKALLAAASPVFDRMFCSNMQEAVTSKVVINDMEPETMELLVGWLYGKVDKSLTLRQAAGLFVASDRFNVLDLQKACVKIIAHRVAPMSCMLPDLLVYNLLQYARAIGCDAIVWICRGHLRYSRLGCMMLAGDDAAVDDDETYQSLQRDYLPLAAFSSSPSALQQPACASPQKTYPKLQHQLAGAGAHDENAQADSVQDNPSSTERAQAAQLPPPAEVCFDSQLRAENIFKLSQHRLAAAGLGITGKCAPGLEAVLDRRGAASHSQGCSKTIDINARCCLGEVAGKSRGYADNAGKKSVLGRAAGALGSQAKGYLLTGAVASLGVLAATAYSSSSSSSRI